MPTNSPHTKPIEIAKKKTDDVREQMAIAGAELNLTNTILERELPAGEKQGDVGKALEQNRATEEKVNQAAEELAVVSEQLEEEVAHRHQLERELTRRSGD
ncbi:MAG: hypothetical protein ABIU58_05705 [Ramlibacter sp.]